MKTQVKLLAIIGSASKNSSNEHLVAEAKKMSGDHFSWTILNDLKFLPHFDPELSQENAPEPVLQLRNLITEADAILISTPEYVFSIPSGLKNLIEWTVATTVWDRKPCALITASAHGAKAHEALQLLMQTVGARLTPETCLLIQGIKSKVSISGQITDETTEAAVSALMQQLHSFAKQ